jgi:hypothetical protein
MMRSLRAALFVAARAWLQVFAPASEPHLMLLADSAVRSAEAATAGKTLEPQDSQEVRVQRFVQAVTLRYGEVKQLEVLSVLAGAATTSLGPHWLGLVDIDGQLNLDGLMRQKQQGVDAQGEGKQKVELNLEQLGLLGQ